MTYDNHIFIYLCLIFVLSHIFIGVDSFIPIKRLAHSSVLVGNKIYFFGGSQGHSGCSNEVFYLDVSQSFDVATPPWNDLTPSA